jgi:hypothetical protein
MSANIASPSTRQRLPNRRLAVTFGFEPLGLRYVCTVGRFADGRVAEIFVQNHKPNSAADTSARDCAIAVSLALQYGANLETIRRAFCQDSNGRPASPVGAALDLVASSSC